MAIDILEPSVEKYVFLGIVCAIFSFISFIAFPPTGAILIGAVFWGLVFFTPLIMDFFPRLARHPRQRALQAMQGKNYAFDNARVRVFYSEGKVWLATKDVYSALNVPLSRANMQRLVDAKRHRLIPSTNVIGISEADLSACVLRLHASEKERFLHWFERSILFPIHKKLEQGIDIPEDVSR
jgi:hypothetical protein